MCFLVLLAKTSLKWFRQMADFFFTPDVTKFDCDVQCPAHLAKNWSLSVSGNLSRMSVSPAGWMVGREERAPILEKDEGHSLSAKQCIVSNGNRRYGGTQCHTQIASQCPLQDVFPKHSCLHLQTGWNEIFPLQNIWDYVTPGRRRRTCVAVDGCDLPGFQRLSIQGFLNCPSQSLLFDPKQ